MRSIQPVVEAGCKSVVGQRLKQSGMRWSVQGARQLVNLGCALASGLFNPLWNSGHPVNSKIIMVSNVPRHIRLN